MSSTGVIKMRSDDEMTRRIQDAVGEILWINRQIIIQNAKILDDFLSPVYVIDTEAMKTGEHDV